MNNLVVMTEGDKLKSIRIQKSKIMQKQGMWGTLFLAPTLILFVIFSLIPVVLGIYYAFCEFDLITATWSGLVNFEWLKLNGSYWHSILNIFIYVLFFVPQAIILALLAANLLNRKMKGIKVFRILYYLPAVTSGVAISFVWKFMFNEYYGLFNQILNMDLKWNNTLSYFAMFSISMVTVWSSIGGNMLVFLAGLQGISPELYEAAEIDGAGSVKKFFKITVPMIIPTLYFVLTMSIIGAFQLFDVVQILGSSNYYSQTPVTLIYNAIGRFEGGRAAAESLVLFAVIMLVSFGTQFITKLTSKSAV